MACRLFAESGLEMMLSQSFAKNMGVLGEFYFFSEFKEASQASFFQKKGTLDGAFFPGTPHW